MPHEGRLISDRVIDIVNDPVKCQLLIDYITKPDLRESLIIISKEMKDGVEVFDIRVRERKTNEAPKEKADELVKMFSKIAPGEWKDIECARIVVNEIIMETPMYAGVLNPK